MLNILTAIGKAEYFASHSVVNVSSAGDTLMESYNDVWIEQVYAKPKLCTYRLVKNKVTVEPYLTAKLPRWKCTLISRLRCGVLSLKIEQGRFCKLPLEHRICDLCRNAVETEFHFLFECVNLSNIRKLYELKIPELIGNLPHHEKLTILGNMPYVFANYVAELWIERLNFLK